MEMRERASSWRGSMNSIASVDKGTQTDEENSRSPSHSPAKRNSQPPSPIRKESEHVEDSSDDDEQVNGFASLVREPSHIETAVPVVVKARMVTVPKRVPPLLPPRNPNRRSQSIDNDKDGDGFDTVSLNGSNRSDLTLEEKRGSITEVPHTSDQTQVSSTDEKTRLGANGASGVVGDDEFHSVPPSPAKEQWKGIPGAF
jgi:hypothetical protein